MASRPPLVISSYTLRTEVGYRQRVRAAAVAGFDGTGLRAENYWQAMASGFDERSMATIAEDGGIAVAEVGYVTAWGAATDRDAAQQRKPRSVFNLARTFGVRHGTPPAGCWPTGADRDRPGPAMAPADRADQLRQRARTRRLAPHQSHWRPVEPRRRS